MNTDRFPDGQREYLKPDRRAASWRRRLFWTALVAALITALVILLAKYGGEL